jgi:hypothetical protein
MLSISSPSKTVNTGGVENPSRNDDLGRVVLKEILTAENAISYLFLRNVIHINLANGLGSKNKLLW